MEILYPILDSNNKNGQSSVFNLDKIEKKAMS
jgi:hypothetical protein